MDRRLPDIADEFEVTAPDISTDGMPSWSKRELSKVFLEDVSRSPGIDKPFLFITLLLLLIGLIMLLSASFVSANRMPGGGPLLLFQNQAVFAIAGVSGMFIISRFSVRFISRWSLQLLVVSIALLVLVLLIGVRVNGATRWLGVGGDGTNTVFRFQPSEITKVAIILAFAQMSVKFGEKRMRTLKRGVVPFVLITLVILVLLYQQPHISAMIIIAVTAAVMMFAGGTRLRYFLMAAIAGLLIAAAVLVPNFIGNARQSGVQGALQETSLTEIDFSGMGHWGRRIETWLNPDMDPLGDGFQARQSLNAVGSGGWLGQGLGQSRQKHQYLPEEHNDFIFAIIVEELGFIGGMMILLLFVLLVVRGYWIALHAINRYSSLIVIGITTLLAMQVFFNVSVVLNIFPATGIALPLFSYGGTALMVQLAQLGVVLAVSREIPLVKADDFYESDAAQEEKQVSPI